ncbi:MAG: tetratricopeptide repeat protein, partial [Planctomycetota bacterium]
MAISLHSLAGLLQTKGDYESAESLIRRALEMRKNAFGKDHPDVAQSLNSLANLLLAKGDYEGAEPLYRRTLEIYEKVFGKDHPDLAGSLNSLANLLFAKGDYERAEPLYRRSLEIYEKVFGKEHPDVVGTLNNLANLLRAKGDYERAEPLYRRTLEMREKMLGKWHPYVAISLHSLAGLLQIKGDYESAESLCRQALEIYEKVLGKEHPDLVATLNILSGLLSAKGDYEGAESLIRRSLEIYEKIFGKDHPDLAGSLNNLASLLQAKGDYEGAEPFYRRSLEIREKVLGKDHPDLAGGLNNLASLLQDKGDYKGAEPFYRRSLEIREKVLGKEHPSVASSLNNLASLLQDKGDYKGAEPMYRRALDILERVMGKDHPAVATSLNNLANLLQAKGDYEGAEPFFWKGFNSISNHLKKMLPILMERQQELYLNQNVRPYLNHYFSVLQDPKKQNEVYENLLAYRGANSRILRNRNRFAVEPEQSHLFEEMKQARSAYANCYLSPDPKLTPEIQQKLLLNALKKKEALERTLVEKSKEFRRTDTLNNATLQEIRNTLSENEAILDFLFYHHIVDWKRLEAEERLLVFLITKDSPVIRVDFGKVEDLRSAIEAFRSQLQGGPRRILANEQYADDTLYETLWKPLEKLLEGKEHLYVIPDGDLAFIPFEALPVEIEGEKQYLAELKTISYLFSPLDLFEYQLYNEENELSLLCLGDVAYNEVPEQLSPKVKLRSGFSEGGSQVNWSALPGTAEECKAILSDFQKAHPQNSTEYLSERKASKANLLEKAVGKKYVHLATHGYFN